MKLLVLNYEFPPVGGGGGKISEDICRALAAKGYEIRVVTARFKGLPCKELRDGYTIIRGPALRGRRCRCTVPEMFSFVAGCLPTVLRQIKDWRPDLVHAHFAVPTGLLALAGRLACNVPYVISTHLGDIPGAVPEQTDRLFKFVRPLSVPIWRRAAAVTVGSVHEEGLVHKAYGREVEIIPNGIAVSQVRQSPVVPHSPVRIVFAGRFAPQKNLPLLLDVLERCRHLDWRMDVFGDGQLMPMVRRRVDAAGLKDRIALHGWVDQDAVDQAFSNADILFLPSWAETYSQVNLQALASGLAVLSSDVDGIRELVEDGVNGRLCPAGNVAAYTQAFKEMMDAKTLSRMKAASRHKAYSFDLEHITDCFESLFRRVCRETGHGNLREQRK